MEQGDLLPNCPVPRVRAVDQLVDGGELDVEFEIHDLAVLTQSCDLANDKVETVLLGLLRAWDDVVAAKPDYDGKRMRKKVLQGLLPGVCLLHRRKEESKLPWSIVDFHHLFVLLREFVTAHANSVGPRLRLDSPYREHLAQALASYFMRVGLPHDAALFESDPGPP